LQNISHENNIDSITTILYISLSFIKITQNNKSKSYQLYIKQCPHKNGTSKMELKLKKDRAQHLI